MGKLKRLKIRWALQAFWLVLLVGAFYYINSTPRFLAIASDSMTPTIPRGDLILVQKVKPETLQEGDIIIFKIPQTLQNRYSYPPSVCHRIIKIQSSVDGLIFQTKGDNSAQDPFVVLPQQIVGKESQSIHYVGYVLMFPQSKQGWYFLIGLIILILVYGRSDSILKGARKTRSAVFGISREDYLNSQQELEKKMEGMSSQVARSMENFSTAMNEYAKHIASHTSAVQSLAEAAKHLETIVAKQEELLIQKVVATEAKHADVQKMNEDKPRVATRKAVEDQQWFVEVNAKPEFTSKEAVAVKQEELLLERDLPIEYKQCVIARNVKPTSPAVENVAVKQKEPLPQKDLATEGKPESEPRIMKDSRWNPVAQKTEKVNQDTTFRNANESRWSPVPKNANEIRRNADTRSVNMDWQCPTNRNTSAFRQNISNTNTGVTLPAKPSFLKEYINSFVNNCINTQYAEKHNVRVVNPPKK